MKIDVIPVHKTEYEKLVDVMEQYASHLFRDVDERVEAISFQLREGSKIKGFSIKRPKREDVEEDEDI